MSGFISWTNNLKWRLVICDTLCVFKLELQGFYPCCDVWIGSWIYLCCTFCFVFVLYSVLWCWVHRLLGSTSWCSSIFSCLRVCENTTFKSLRGRGQTFTLSPHFCFSVINYIWIIVSECCRQPDQIRLFFAEKRTKTSQQVKRENMTIWERNRQRVKKRTEWEQSFRVGSTLLCLNSITVY